MNRSTFILGFALLAVAFTLAATITLRNAPRPAAGAATEANRPVAGGSGQARQDAALPSSEATRTARPDEPGALQVSLPPAWLESMPAGERSVWQTRVGQVETQAREQLERLTAELDLSAAQRRKLFPALVRSAPGYDPAMLVAGVPAASDTALTAGEEIHQALDPDQQATVEDQEVNRQLWWQDIISKLENDLVRSTGGSPEADTPAPTQDNPPAGEREAPGPRQDGNLFDLLPTQP